MRRITWGAIAVAAALMLAACGSDSGKDAASGGDHNSADVAFAQGMIPHHEQAIEMAELAGTRAAHPQVKALATQIEAAQDPEIKQMTTWLKSWGEPTAAPQGHSTTGGGHSVAGMMSDADMAKLAGLSGKDFDRMFLTMMTAHHNGAIEMARTEQKDGRYAAGKKLAANIIKGQSAEVALMADLLKQV